MTEWKQISWAPGYEVSDGGRVRSWRTNGGRVARPKPKYLKPDSDRMGHLRVTLSVGGVTTRRMVHVLVLEAFVGPRPPRQHGCHNNGNPADNRLENLRWDTASGNNRDKEAHGTWQGRENNPAAKLTDEQVEAIKVRLGNGEKHRDIAAVFGVSKSTVTRINKGHGKGSWGKYATVQPRD